MMAEVSSPRSGARRGRSSDMRSPQRRQTSTSAFRDGHPRPSTAWPSEAARQANLHVRQHREGQSPEQDALP